MGKILVVDDQRNMRTTLAMMLRGAGYEVDEASDGSEGADRGGRGAYDVVLTDLRMGGFDGIGVLRSVKESRAATEVIVMTAYGTIESAVEAMLTKLLCSEEEHVDWLETQLKLIETLGDKAYLAEQMRS